MVKCLVYPLIYCGRMKPNNHAFSLIELSVVIAVIGLLVGGVLGSQQLIRASELRSITEDVSVLRSAMGTFKERYNGLPGDLTNATLTWGAAAVPASCSTTQGVGTQTCDGNGDGKIGDAVTAARAYEQFRFFQHLALAGLLEGRYSGIAGAGGSYHATPGTNVPKSRIEGAGNTVLYGGDVGITAWAARAFPGGKDGNYILYGSVLTDNTMSMPFLTAEEAMNIDTKFDDGFPGLGSYKSWIPSWAPHADCASTAVPGTALYQPDRKTVSCAFLIEAGL